MDPFTIGAIIAGLFLVGALSWQKIKSWLDGYRSRAKTARLIREALAGGKVKVNATVFNSSYLPIAEESWQSDSIDGELESRFSEGNVAYITI